MVLLAVAGAGCGSNTKSANGCDGYATAKHAKQLLVLFGAVSKFTKRDVCAQVGAPTNVRAAAGGREAWSYGNETLIFRGNRLVNIRSKRVPIGG